MVISLHSKKTGHNVALHNHFKYVLESEAMQVKVCTAVGNDNFLINAGFL